MQAADADVIQKNKPPAGVTQLRHDDGVDPALVAALYERGRRGQPPAYSARFDGIAICSMPERGVRAHVLLCSIPAGFAPWPRR